MHIFFALFTLIALAVSAPAQDHQIIVKEGPLTGGSTIEVGFQHGGPNFPSAVLVHVDNGTEVMETIVITLDENGYGKVNYVVPMWPVIVFRSPGAEEVGKIVL